ncbi:MAG: DUF4185 domain-containing protein [Actinomycetota bacterium]
MCDIVMGASVVADNGSHLIYGWDHEKRIVLARRQTDDTEWWSRAPDVVIEDGATEFTVHYDQKRDMWLQTQMISSSGELALRTAQQPQGPWSRPHVVFQPEEARRPEAFVYAGKAHPHLTGADLVLTYASIAEADVTLADDSLYFPRFVRLGLE